MYSRFGYIRHLGNLILDDRRSPRRFAPRDERCVYPVPTSLTLLAMTIYYTPKGYNSA